MMTRIALLASCAISAQSDQSEGLSLLQTHALLNRTVHRRPGQQGGPGCPSLPGKDDATDLIHCRPNGPQGLSQEAGIPFRTPGLPDPKKQASVEMSRAYDMINEKTPFECKNGKGKWVWMNTGPTGPTQGTSQATSVHLQRTKDLQEIVGPDHTGNIHYNAQKDLRPVLPSGGRGAMGRRPDGSHLPAFTKATYTERGVVKDEKDCYARARADADCMMWLDSQFDAITYPGSKIAPEADALAGKTGWKPTSAPVLGVFYKHTLQGSSADVFSDCMCGRLNTWNRLVVGKPVPEDAIRVGDFKGELPGSPPGGEGVWFCQLTPGDLAYVTVKDEESDEKAPKEKKTKEEKEKCAKAKADAKTSRAALKALRKQLKDARAAVKALKAQLNAAKEDFLAKKGARKELC